MVPIYYTEIFCINIIWMWNQVYCYNLLHLSFIFLTFTLGFRLNMFIRHLIFLRLVFHSSAGKRVGEIMINAYKISLLRKFSIEYQIISETFKKSWSLSKRSFTIKLRNERITQFTQVIAYFHINQCRATTYKTFS